MQDEFKTYSKTGLCFYCLELVQALQPGGLNPCHVADQVPYGQCRKALERPKWKPEEIWNGEPLVNEDEFPLKNQDYSVAIKVQCGCSPASIQRQYPASTPPIQRQSRVN